jgi:integrase
MSRSVVYEQIRAGRLRSVTQGRARFIPATALAEYVNLLITESHAGRRGFAASQALREQRARQDVARRRAGHRWHDTDLVFASEVGTPLNSANVRRGFRRIAAAAGLTAQDWTPRELRHSFVSLLSDSGLPIEQISRLVGHSGTSVTELVYRKQIRPVLDDGATAMDRIFQRPQA